MASNAEESHLREFFSTAGEIERIRVSAPKANATRKAYIEFTASEAVSAAVLLNGCLLLNHPLNIVECAYPVAEDANFEDRVELNALETRFAGFLGKTLLAGKQALEAVKDFDERNQISAKAKENLRAVDEKYHVSANIKATDEKYGLSEGVKTAKARAAAQINELDKSYKISATTSAVVGIGKDVGKGVVNRAMENPVISKASNQVVSGLNTATAKVKAISADAVAPLKSAQEENENAATVHTSDEHAYEPAPTS